VPYSGAKQGICVLIRTFSPQLPLPQYGVNQPRIAKG